MRTAKTIADLVIGTPSSIPILERLGIDYCCHGQQDVYQACRSAGVTTGELMKMIEASHSIERCEIGKTNR
jgi:regulator of cell morphogenesis and NO signaling